MLIPKLPKCSKNSSLFAVLFANEYVKVGCRLGCRLWTSITDTSSPNGKFVPTFSRLQCLTRCLTIPTCLAVDVWPITRCTIHTITSDLTTKIPTQGVTQFLLNRQCIAASPSTAGIVRTTGASHTTVTGSFSDRQ